MFPWISLNQVVCFRTTTSRCYASGGFPEAQNSAAWDHYDLPRGYVDAMLLRDVIKRHAVSHPVALRWMVRQLHGNAGGAFSVNKFNNDLCGQGIALAKDTLTPVLAIWKMLS